MKQQQRLILMAIGFIFLYSCRSNTPASTSSIYDNGVFIAEQGNFMNGTGTLSFLNKANNTLSKDIFNIKNGFAIGNVLQSVNVINDIGYLVVNNANKVVTFSTVDLKYNTTINGLISPRYIQKVTAQKAYISEWGDSSSDGAVRVLDLTTNQISKRIKVGNGAEQILVYGNRAYVTCVGGLGNSDSMAIINIDFDTLVGKIAVGANPEGIVQDADNNIWILCKGKWNANFSALATTGSIVRYNTFTNKIDKTFMLASVYSQPTGLCLNKNKNRMYYSYDGGLWFLDNTATALRPVPFIYGNMYSVGVDPNTNIIYTGDAKDFASNGLVRRFDEYGGLIDSFSVGIIPGDFHFRNK
jgi:hypothetical protein